MTTFYGDYPFFPFALGKRLDIAETNKVDYWENIAEQAVEFFAHKDDFMDWVCSHYGSDENRFTADCAWDLVKLKQEPEEPDCD